MKGPTHREKSIFRPEALARYHKKGETAVIPKFAHPRLFPKLWAPPIVLLLLILGLLFWPKTHSVTVTGALHRLPTADSQEWIFDIPNPNFLSRGLGQRVFLSHEAYGFFLGRISSNQDVPSLSPPEVLPQMSTRIRIRLQEPSNSQPPLQTQFQITFIEPEFRLIDLLFRSQS